MFFKKNLLRDSHFSVHINTSDDGSESGDTEHDVVNGVVLGLRLREQNAEIDDDDLLWESEEGRDSKIPEFDVAS